MEGTAAIPPPPPRTRRRPQHLADDLLEAAAAEFACFGFDGASTRRIARRAGAHQPQINYHFTSKERLWQATVTRLFERMEARAFADPGPLDMADFLADGIRRFVRFSADHPELNRMINLEATSSSTRLDWLVATHLLPLYELVGALWTGARASGRGTDLSTSQVWELITGYGALHFANQPMLSKLGTDEAHDASDANRHADRVLRLLFPEDPSGAGPGSGPGRWS